MVKILLHYRSDPTSDWINEDSDFSRVPCVGEYVKSSASDTCYHVSFVLHCAVDADYKAEIFADPAGSITDAIAARRPTAKLTESPVVGQVTKAASDYAVKALARVNEMLERLTEKK